MDHKWEKAKRGIDLKWVCSACKVEFKGRFGDRPEGPCYSVKITPLPKEYKIVKGPWFTDTFVEDYDIQGRLWWRKESYE